MRDTVAALGGLPLLVLGLAAGVVLLRWRKTETWGRRWLAALAIAYVFMSTLPAPLLLAGVLGRGYQPLSPGPALDGVSTVVVLSGGSDVVTGQDRQVGLLTRESMSRVLEGIRAFHMIRDGRIVATGAAEDWEEGTARIPEALVMRSTLIEMGIPADRVLLEPEGRNTHEQAVKVAAMLRAQAIDRVVLVTSAFHMARAAGCFRAAGLVPIPAVSGSGSDENFAADFLIPNEGSLQLSRWVLHEYVGLAYYRARGWMR